MKPGTNFLCAKSIEGLSPGFSSTCGHHAELEGRHTPLYGFQVLLFDANSGSPPIYATIFDNATKLLDMEAHEFALLEEAHQGSLLQSMTFDAPLVNAWFRLIRNAPPILSKLDRIVVLHDEDDSEYHTPVKELAKFHSPTSAEGSSSKGNFCTPTTTKGGSSSSKPQTEVKRGHLNLSQADAIELAVGILSGVHITDRKSKADSD